MIYYITGCRTVLEVKPSIVQCNQGDRKVPFTGLNPQTCPTSLLLRAKDTDEAKELCRRCPKAEVQPYLEASPPALQLAEELQQAPHCAACGLVEPGLEPVEGSGMLCVECREGLALGSEETMAEPPPAKESTTPKEKPTGAPAGFEDHPWFQAQEVVDNPVEEPAEPESEVLAEGQPGDKITVVRVGRPRAKLTPPPDPPELLEPEESPVLHLSSIQLAQLAHAVEVQHLSPIATTNPTVTTTWSIGMQEEPEPELEPELEPEPEPEPKGLGIDLRGKRSYGKKHAQPAVAPPTLHDLLIGSKGGPTIFGSTTVKTARECRRKFWWLFLVGWKPQNAPERADGDKVRLSPLAVGSAMHAAVEAYLCANFDPIAGTQVIDKLKPHYPALAAEVNRLLTRYLDRFLALDKTTWDVRGVELEARYYFGPRKVEGVARKLQLCVTSRYDSVYRPIQPGAARLPLDERSTEPLVIHDLKTISAISGSALDAYRHALQPLLASLCWRGVFMAGAGIGGELLERFGAADRFAVTWVGKARETFDPRKHVGRVSYTIPKTLIDEFAQTTEDWLYDEIAPRLFSPHALEQATWPKDYACLDPITNRTCPYLALCEAQDHANPDGGDFVKTIPWNPSSLVKPRQTKARKGGAPAQTENK